MAASSTSLGLPMRIFVARDSKQKYLTSFRHHISRHLEVISYERCNMIRTSTEPLFYFHQEPLQATDVYLVMASCNLFDYLNDTDFMLPVLRSRIDAVGLNEACKSMAGPYRDGNKILVVITLQPGAHEPKSISHPLDEKLLSTMEYVYDPDGERFEDNPLAFLLPYVNGKKQEPVPLTSIRYYGFHEIPELFSEDEVEIESSVKQGKK